jgi:hypothetical protein
MAELYLSQGHRDEALGVYRQLVESRPGDEALRARLSALEAESTAAVSSTDAAPAPTDRASRPSGRSIREFLGDIAARRPRTNGSSGSGVTEQPSSTSGNELPFLTDVPASASSSAYASPEPTTPSLPDLSAEVGGVSVASIPAASRAAESTARDSAASVAGSLGALFAEAESPGRGAGAGGSLVADGAVTPDNRGHGNAATRESVTGEHAPLPGRPTQPAATELSLDYVFRHVTPAKGTPEKPNFSFDQFFSQESQHDAGTSGGEPTREPATDESDDIQQFNAWLEGLKKS